MEKLIDNKNTDKNTRHSYLHVYEKLFISKKNTCKKILEIGLGDRPNVYGGSAKLWLDYFKNADVYILDILKEDFYKGDMLNTLKSYDKLKLFLDTNAYDLNFINSNLNTKFDIIMDDGPHSKSSMIKFIKYYLPLLADDGILIIEDVKRISWTKEFISLIPENYQKYIEIYDLRKNKNRYDDILFVLNKNK
jgi:hypothetical protein